MQDDKRTSLLGPNPQKNSLFFNSGAFKLNLKALHFKDFKRDVKRKKRAVDMYYIYKNNIKIKQIRLRGWI